MTPIPSERIDHRIYMLRRRSRTSRRPQRPRYATRLPRQTVSRKLGKAHHPIASRRKRTGSTARSSACCRRPIPSAGAGMNGSRSRGPSPRSRRILFLGGLFAHSVVLGAEGDAILVARQVECDARPRRRARMGPGSSRARRPRHAKRSGERQTKGSMGSLPM